MANAFREGTYPSPIEGIKRGYESFIADQARRKADNQNQRYQMMQWFAQRMVENQRREEQERDFALRQEQAYGGYGSVKERTEAERTYAAGQAATKRQKDYDTWVKKYGTPEQQQQWKIDLARERGKQSRKSYAARPKAGMKEPKDLTRMDYDKLVRLSNDTRNAPEVYTDIMYELRDRGYDVAIPQVDFETAYQEALQMVQARANPGLIKSVLKELGWNPELNAFRSLFPTGRTSKRMMER